MIIKLIPDHGSGNAASITMFLVGLGSVEEYDYPWEPIRRLYEIQ